MPNDHTVTLCGQQIDRPGHICAFFQTRSQEYDTLLPYLRDGIDAGEEVFNIVAQSRHHDHVHRLAESGLQAAPNAVSVRTSEETYLEGGEFNMDRMCDFVHARLTEAQSSGRRVRTAGWMDWITRDAIGTDRAMEYEARMNLLVPAFDCTFMCVYDLATVSGAMVVDILATHQYAIINGQIRQNPFFIPPDIYLDQLLKGNRTAPLLA